MAKFSCLFVSILFPFILFSQSSYAPLNEDYYHWIDRYEVKTGQIIPHVFTTIKPYRREDITAYLDSARALGVFSSRTDAWNEQYLHNDNWEWSSRADNDSKKPFLKAFYKKKSDLYSVHNEDFDLHINPVLHLEVGKEQGADDLLFVNTRGVEIRGMIDGKVGFYTYLTDNQARLPTYVEDYTSIYHVIPHEGFWKTFKTNAVDYLQARGYITFNATRHFAFQLGHDRQFIGNGIRSLAYSDFAPPMWFIKGNVKIWRINYMFSFNQLTANIEDNGITPISSRLGYPQKFNAFHHLSIHIGKKLNVGVFESVVLQTSDSANFRLDYFNPIIFYRAVEQQNGSTDNVLLGFDAKWNVIPKVSLYGQFLLDEFVLEQVTAGDGWWANKYGVQLGAKYIDAAGIENLDLQAEVNIVRPYTYSHDSQYGNYSHYLQSLAHPLGANLNEVIGVIRYQPLARLNLTAKLFFIRIGKDGPDENWGSDILKNSNSREQEYGNEIGQGAAQTISTGTFIASWHLKHNLFIDGQLLLRRSESDLAFYNKNSTIATLALRWNIPRRQYEF